MEIKSIKKEWNATILDILKAFMEICKTHNLRYYIAALVLPSELHAIME